MFSENQVRDLIVFSAEATETTASTFMSTASANEVKVLQADGSAVPTAKGNFKIFAKLADGTMKPSEVINPDKVESFTKIAPKTAVLGRYDVTIPANLTANTLLKINFRIHNWGSKSVEDEYFKYAVYKVKSGDDQEQIINGLIASLANNFEREEPRQRTFTTINNYNVEATYASQSAAVSAKGNLSNGQVIAVTADSKYYTVTDVSQTTFAAIFTELADTGSFTIKDNPLFTFTKTGNGTTISLRIQEKEQEYVAGKRQAHPIDFMITNDFGATQTRTARVVNPGSGRRVRDLEWFVFGEFGDVYREMGYPNNFEDIPSSVSLTGSYYMVNLAYYDGDGKSHAIQRSPRVLQLASTSQSVINSIIDDIETATGLTLAAFS